MNQITTAQAIQYLVDNGMKLTIESGFSNFLSTVISTLIGAVFGGIITLWVNRKFELDRLRINNIIDMHRAVTPEIQSCTKALGVATEFLNNVFDGNDTSNYVGVLEILRENFFILNQEVNNYEIELSYFLDYYETILYISTPFLQKFSEKDEVFNKENNENLKMAINILVDKLATFSEDISEFKKDAINGKRYKYWKNKLK